jgi:hypothetical protein
MMRSYGVHWHIDRVFWGKQNNAGTLFGAASRSSRARPVDFREQRGRWGDTTQYYRWWEGAEEEQGGA